MVKIVLTLSSLLILIAVVIRLSACQHDVSSKKPYHLITIGAKKQTIKLHFAGYVQPLKTVAITAPLAGTVTHKAFAFGQQVVRGELLYVMRADKNQLAIQSTLSAFLKAKQSLSTSKSAIENAAMLHKNGLIADNEYQQATNNYYTNQLTFLQSQNALNTALQHFPSLRRISSLTIADSAKIKTLMGMLAKKRNIKVFSPISGISLMANNDNTATGSHRNSGQARVGTEVKSGEVLVVIGQLNGMAVTVAVNEFDIEKIHSGQKAIITSPVLTGLKLTGMVKTISLQANTSGAVPTFTVRIVVPALTPQEQKQWRIGMSAKVTIAITLRPHIVIPIKALLQRGTKTLVRVVAKDGSLKTLPIITGQTTMTGVAVTAGLKAGERVVVPY